MVIRARRFTRGLRGPLAAVAIALSLARPSHAEDKPHDDTAELPRITVRTPADATGRRVVRVDVVPTDPTWPLPEIELSLHVGDLFTPASARRAVRELTASGSAAESSIEATREGDGVAIKLLVVPQRVVAELRVTSDIDPGDVLRTAGVERGRAVTPLILRETERALRDRARRLGYPGANPKISTRSTDDPHTIVLLVDVQEGPARVIAAMRTEVAATHIDEHLRTQIDGYGSARGERADDEDFSERDRALTLRLRAAGWHRATAEHRIYEIDGKTYLRLKVIPGPLVKTRYEGNHVLDAAALDDVLDLERESDRSAARVTQKIRDEYHHLGFLDAEVSVALRGGPDDDVQVMAVTIHEHQRVRVAQRTYPCITGHLTPKELGSEIDSYLEDELPGATLLTPVDPGVVDQQLSPSNASGARPAPLDLEPRSVYAPETYERAMKHVQDIYRSEGYLTALVGPLQLIRRRCDPRSKPGECIPVPLRPIVDRCAVDAQGVPLDEPRLPLETLCIPNPLKGITCEPDLVLRIPVKAGPLAILYDVVFDGAVSLKEPDLLAVSTLSPGDPASNVKIEEGRKLILDKYRDEGFAFAEVTSTVELSPDKQRARVRFSVLERQRVTIDQIYIRGNTRTEESVIRTRLRFKSGGLYRMSEVRRSEELVATLGTFSSVTVGLEDPSIPATKKSVVITVVERDPQYLEIRPGVSTGEGVRGLLEYGHRNLLGQAIQLTIRVQLNYLPDFLIPEESVRQNFQKLPLIHRLERRNTIGIQFPNVFDPNIRFGVDLVDARTNSRDFGLTKEAIIPTFTWSPLRGITGTVGGSVELNTVGIFDGSSVEQYLLQPGISGDLARLLRVPDGTTTAVAQRTTLAWDRRDNPLGATRGTLVAGSVEHVHAYPASDNTQQITSDFLRFSGRVGGYIRLSKKGTALAVQLAGGYNRQLISGSKTYPDRLFFLGGVDTIRGFARDSLVPQDLADRIDGDSKKSDNDPSKFTVDKIAIRGGDISVNPRVELRIPLSGPIETALFVDAGNVWVDPTLIIPYRLRYAGGTGLRVATPVGPIALDYGINLNRRAWEDFGAIHFSIGLFLTRRQLIVRRLTLSLALLVPACAPSPRHFVHDASAESSLLAADRAFNEATQKRGVEGWVSFFAEDGVQFPAKQPVIRGHEAIRREMAPLFDDKSAELTWEPAEASIAASGDLGFTIGHAILSKIEGGQKSVLKKLKYLTVWKRQSDGTWKVAADIGNEE